MFANVILDPRMSGPAAVDMNTGDLHLSPVFYQLPKEYQDFILAHEEGHFVLQTRDEFEADHYAFLKLASSGAKLSDNVKALACVLSGRSEQHADRAERMLELAHFYDSVTNKDGTDMSQMNEEQRATKRSRAVADAVTAISGHLAHGNHDQADAIAAHIMDLIPENQIHAFSNAYLEHRSNFEGDDEDSEVIEYYEGSDPIYGTNLVPFLGKKKAPAAPGPKKGYNEDGTFDLTTKEGRAAQAADAKSVKVKGQAQAKVTRADAKKSLADQGVDGGAGVKDLIGKGLNLAANIAGKVADPAGMAAQLMGGADNSARAIDAAPIDTGAGKAPDAKKVPWMWIGIGGGVLVIAIILIWYFTRSKAA